MLYARSSRIKLDVLLKDILSSDDRNLPFSNEPHHLQFKMKRFFSLYKCDISFEPEHLKLRLDRFYEFYAWDRQNL